MIRKILLFFVIVSFALAGLIYWDYSNRNVDSEPETTHQHSGNKPDDTKEPSVFSDIHTSVDITNAEAVRARIDEIEIQFEKGLKGKEAVPFYGELMLLYLQLNREDAAAEASRHVAMIMNDAEDWWNAALLFYKWGLKQQSEELFMHYMNRSNDTFWEASVLNPSPLMLTDHAIVLQALGKTDEALSQLERARKLETADYKPFLYTGLILNETGKKDESILYIYRSLELAVNEDEKQLIRTILAESSIEI